MAFSPIQQVSPKMERSLGTNEGREKESGNSKREKEKETKRKRWAGFLFPLLSCTLDRGLRSDLLWAKKLTVVTHICSSYVDSTTYSTFASAG